MPWPELCRVYMVRSFQFYPPSSHTSQYGLPDKPHAALKPFVRDVLTASDLIHPSKPIPNGLLLHSIFPGFLLSSPNGNI